MESTKLKIVWMITERGDRSFWTRIGVGTVNRDGSITFSLDAFPASNSKLQLRDYTPRDAEHSAAAERPDEPALPVTAASAPQPAPQPALARPAPTLAANSHPGANANAAHPSPPAAPPNGRAAQRARNEARLEPRS